MDSKWIRKFFKDSTIYGLGGIIAKSIGFFLLPIYTRMFNPEQYGYLEMITVLNGFLVTLMVMGTDSAQSFYFFKEKANGKNSQTKIISSILQWRILWGIFVILFATLMAPLLNKIFFNTKFTLQIFIIAFITVFFTQVMSQTIEVFRLWYRPWSFIGLTTFNTLLTSFVILFNVITLDLGIFGYILGQLFGTVISASFGLYLIRNYVNFSISNLKVWPSLLKFSLPLLPVGLVMWFVNTSDRWFINYYLSAESLGLYGVGAKFSIFIATSVTIFRQAWWPIAMDTMHSSDGPSLYRLVSRLYIGLSMVGIILLTAISPFLVDLLTTSDFHKSYPIVGVLAFSSVFYGFILISGAGVWKAEKTWWQTIAIGIGAILNILLNIVLIPLIGIIGAAIATSLSMLVTNIILIIVSERYWKISLPYLRLSFAITVTALSVFAILWMYKVNNIANVYLFSISAIFLLVLILVRHDERRYLINLISRK